MTEEAREALAAQGVAVESPSADDTTEIPVYNSENTADAWFADATADVATEYPAFDSVGIPEESKSGPSGYVGGMPGPGEWGPPTFSAGEAIDRELDKPLIPSDKPRRPPDTGVPDKDEWLDFFSRIVLKVGLELYTDFAFRGIDEDVVSESDLRRIRVSKEERDIIARPFAEYSTKNKFLRKHGREVVAFADSLESLVTLGIWMRKVNRIAAKYKPKKEKRQPTVRIKPERGAYVNGNDGQNQGPGTNGQSPGNDEYIVPTIFNPGSG